MPGRTGKQFLGFLFARAALVFSLAVALVFAVDAGLLRYRASANRNAFSTVTVHPYYTFPRKDKKTELIFDEPHDETCSNSLFPQMGYSPCWYLRRHTDEQMPNSPGN